MTGRTALLTAPPPLASRAARVPQATKPVPDDEARTRAGDQARGSLAKFMFDVMQAGGAEEVFWARTLFANPPRHTDAARSVAWRDQRDGPKAGWLGPGVIFDRWAGKASGKPRQPNADDARVGASLRGEHVPWPVQRKPH